MPSFSKNRTIAVTQREITDSHNETRDSLDRCWYDFLHQCQLTPLLIPNHLPTAKNILQSHNHYCGILLTGGGDITSLGGKDTVRDDIENYMLTSSIKHNIPLLGICRGMQKIQDYFGISLIKIDGHIMPEQDIFIDNHLCRVNSYHHYGSYDTNDNFKIWAKAQDSVVKAITHISYPITGSCCFLNIIGCFINIIQSFNF